MHCFLVTILSESSSESECFCVIIGSDTIVRVQTRVAANDVLQTKKQVLSINFIKKPNKIILHIFKSPNTYYVPELTGNKALSK